MLKVVDIILLQKDPSYSKDAAGTSTASGVITRKIRIVVILNVLN
jgi:hypothetical protein